MPRATWPCPCCEDVALAVAPGECLALVGPSGAGKSTLLRSLYGNYRPQSGSIQVRHRDAGEVGRAGRRRAPRHARRAPPHDGLRQPVPARDPAGRRGRRRGRADGAAAARHWTRRAVAPNSCSACSAFPTRLWALPPATFSGGEQQRVNIARSLIADYPILLLDEPTASLDTANRDGVIDLIRQRREAGAAIVGIFHDVAVRDALATRLHNVALARSTAMSPWIILTNGRIVTRGCRIRRHRRGARRPHRRGEHAAARAPPVPSISRATTWCPAWSSCIPTIWRSTSRRGPA